MSNETGILGPDGVPVKPSNEDRINKIETVLHYLLKDHEAVAKGAGQQALTSEATLKLILEKGLFTEEEFKTQVEQVHTEYHEALQKYIQEQKQQEQQNQNKGLLDGIAIT